MGENNVGCSNSRIGHSTPDAGNPKQAVLPGLVTSVEQIPNDFAGFCLYRGDSDWIRYGLNLLDWVIYSEIVISKALRLSLD